LSREEITIDDLIRIFGKEIIPEKLDKQILMKHFSVKAKRIIGERTVAKIKRVLLESIDAAKAEQFKDRGGVIESPLDRFTKQSFVNAKSKPSQTQEPPTTSVKPQEEDKYGLGTIKKGLVTKRIHARLNPTQEAKEEQKKSPNSGKEGDHKKPLPSLPTDIEETEEMDTLPSIEDLKVLSGGMLDREVSTEGICINGNVQREIAIRNYQIKDETRSIRWGSELVKDREGKNQEINNPSYIFHSDLWQIEAARVPNARERCDILQHLVLDMVANNINVVMLNEEEEPFFVVEGFGLLHSKDTLRDKIQVNSLIQLVIISCEAWQIALKRPEAMLKGKDAYGKESVHTIDMTSVVPLTNIRNQIVELDGRFNAEFEQPKAVIDKTLRTILNHRKEIIWTCGSRTIPNLRKAIKMHRSFIDKPEHTLNIVVIGTKRAYHPIQVKYTLNGDITFRELLPDYCSKHSILSDNAIRTIFGCIPAIYDTDKQEQDIDEIIKVSDAIYRRLGYSAIEVAFDPGYIAGSRSEMFPISKLDVILPPDQHTLERTLQAKGFKID
jgi:hypothetical protein